MAFDEGRGSGHRRRMKNVIKEIAKEKGLSKHQFYKIQNCEIWEKILDLGYDRWITKTQATRIRTSLPEGYSVRQIHRTKVHRGK